MLIKTYNQAADRDFAAVLAGTANDLRFGECELVQICVVASSDRFFDPKWYRLDFAPNLIAGFNQLALPGEKFLVTWEGRSFESGNQRARFLHVTRQVSESA